MKCNYNIKRIISKKILITDKIDVIEKKNK